MNYELIEWAEQFKLEANEKSGGLERLETFINELKSGFGNYQMLKNLKEAIRNMPNKSAEEVEEENKKNDRINAWVETRRIEKRGRKIEKEIAKIKAINEDDFKRTRAVSGVIKKLNLFYLTKEEVLNILKSNQLLSWVK